MKKKNNTLTIIVVIIFVLFIINNYEAERKAALEPTTLKLYQYAGRFASCDREDNWYCSGTQYLNKPRPIASTEAVIGDYKIVTSLDSYKERTECLTKPNDQATETTIDSDGCQHWSYQQTTYVEHCDFKYGVCANRWASKPCGYHSPHCWNQYTTSSTQTVDYGGKSRVVEEGWGCWRKFDIYRNGNLINRTDWSRASSTFKYIDINMVLGEGEKYDYETNECYRVMNKYDFISFSEEMFDMNTTYKIDKNKKINFEFELKNGWKNISGNLSLNFEIPTTIGIARKSDNLIIELPRGIKTINYSINIDSSTAEVSIIPKLELVDPSSEFSGVNYPDEGSVWRPVASTEYVRYGTLNEDKITIDLINGGQINTTDECSSNITIKCSDGLILAFYECINGKLKATDNECSTPTPSPEPFNQCTSKEYMVAPKCDASIWIDHPHCKWDNSECKSLPNYLLITSIMVILIGMSVFAFTRKKK